MGAPMPGMWNIQAKEMQAYYEQQAVAAQQQAMALYQNQAQNALGAYGNGLLSNAYPVPAPRPAVNYAAEVKEADWERVYREKLEAEAKRADEARTKADLMVEELVVATLDVPSEAG